MSGDCQAAIIGGGISGLATAFFLKQSGVRCTLFEKSARLGGLIRTDTIQGCQLEAGPDSYLAAKPAVTELAAQIGGLKDEIIASNDERRRVYIVRDSRLIEMPAGMSMMVPGDLNAVLRSPLFSPGARFRLFSEIFYPQHCRAGDISVRELVVSHFGEEMLEYVAEPLLSGVYGGDAARLSANSVFPRFVEYEREYGSLIRGVRRERRKATAPGAGSLFLSFRRGMQSLTEALSAAIEGAVDVVYGEVSKLERTAGGWRLGFGDQTFEARQVVLAIPAHSAARLLLDCARELAAELSQIPYSSAILVTLVYDKKDLQLPEGFGFLVPRRERETIAAVTFIAQKWPLRIAPEMAALRAFIVDPQAPELLGKTDEELVEFVQGDFARILHVHASPLFSAVQRWPDSMPQYVIGHAERRTRIRSLLSGFEGLHLTGNAYEGVGIPDCVRLAKQTANLIIQEAGRGAAGAAS